MVALGRITGQPIMCGDEGELLEKEGMSQINRARRSLTAAEKLQMASRREIELKGQPTAGLVDDPSARVADAADSFIKTLQAGFGPRLIRRTLASRRYDGKLLNAALNPYVEHQVPVVLPPHEMEILALELEEIKNG